jgi:hypothetical protein
MSGQGYLGIELIYVSWRDGGHQRETDLEANVNGEMRAEG